MRRITKVSKVYEIQVFFLPKDWQGFENTRGAKVVQQRIRAGAKEFGSDPGAPYVRGGKQNHLEQYYVATRNATKVRHALNHCFAMAEYAHAGKRWPVAMDG